MLYWSDAVSSQRSLLTLSLMSRSLRTLSVLTRPSNSFRPLARFQHSLLQHNGGIKVQHVRFKSDFPR